MIETIFIIYLSLIIFVGILSNRFVSSQLDFLLAGRKLGPWVTAFSERASGESAWLLLGLPGAAIAIGYGEFWAVIGITLGIISSWFLIAEKLRYETEKLDAMTIPDFLEKKFDDKSGIIKNVSALIIGIFFTFYVSAQFHGSGKILNTIFDIDHLYGITLSAMIIIVYTILGGLLAVAWTDLVQGILMIGTLVILPIIGIFELMSFDKDLRINLFSRSIEKFLFQWFNRFFCTFSSSWRNELGFRLFWATSFTYKVHGNQISRRCKKSKMDCSILGYTWNIRSFFYWNYCYGLFWRKFFPG